ncbi:hypothetical protein GCM10011332_21810 [Terasakiella brassicae]|uniref:Uncharacterized protein n=1 Tax=Terasakiella brassicae TaxID=1634917 RepID=A0A917C1J8_9PROT|nr:hypothetical protein GCM10011332_21810 [Terasakiella brassicae]
MFHWGDFLKLGIKVVYIAMQKIMTNPMKSIKIRKSIKRDISHNKYMVNQWIKIK